MHNPKNRKPYGRVYGNSMYQTKSVTSCGEFAMYLYRRQVIQDSYRSQCDDKAKDCIHVLWFFDEAKSFGSLNQCSQNLWGKGLSSVDIIEHILNKVFGVCSSSILDDSLEFVRVKETKFV